MRYKISSLIFTNEKELLLVADIEEIKEIERFIRSKYNAKEKRGWFKSNEKV